MYKNVRHRIGNLVRKAEKTLYAAEVLSPNRLILPDFLGIGAMKSGTTWLYENMRCHPEIYLPETKELYYFSIRFEDCSLRYYSNFFEKGSGLIKGDITPGYSIISSGRIKFIQKIMPRTKLIFLMRNPIHRTWSEACMNLAVKSGRKMGSIADHEFVSYFHTSDCLKRSNYVDILNRWLEFFPSEQLFIASLDDIIEKPWEVLQKIFGFLSVCENPAECTFPFDKWVVPRYENNKMVYRGSIQESHQPTDTLLPDKFRKILEDLYADQMEELHRRYQVPVEKWRSAT
jgi:hypothetical protein